MPHVLPFAQLTIEGFSKEQSVTLAKLFSMSAVEAVHGAVELAHQSLIFLARSTFCWPGATFWT